MSLIARQKFKISRLLIGCLGFPKRPSDWLNIEVIEIAEKDEIKVFSSDKFTDLGVYSLAPKSTSGGLYQRVTTSALNKNSVLQCLHVLHFYI